MLRPAKIRLTCLKRNTLRFTDNGSRAESVDWVLHITIKGCSSLDGMSSSNPPLPFNSIVRHLPYSIVVTDGAFAIQTLADVTGNRSSQLPSALTGFVSIQTDVFTLDTRLSRSAVHFINSLNSGHQLTGGLASIDLRSHLAGWCPGLSDTSHLTIMVAVDDHETQSLPGSTQLAPLMRTERATSQRSSLAAYALSGLLTSLEASCLAVRPPRLLAAYIRCISLASPNMVGYTPNASNAVFDLSHAEHRSLAAWLDYNLGSSDVNVFNLAFSAGVLSPPSDIYNTVFSNLSSVSVSVPSDLTASVARVFSTDSNGVIHQVPSNARIAPVRLPTDYELLRSLVRRSASLGASDSFPPSPSAYDSVSLEALESVLKDTFVQALGQLPVVDSSLSSQEVRMDLQAAFIRAILLA